MHSLKQSRQESGHDILWEDATSKIWMSLFSEIPRSNLLQSWEYGHVIAAKNNQKCQRGLIYRQGAPVGLFQLQTAGLINNALHAVILDRGPLWKKGFGSTEDTESFLWALNKKYPKRFGRRLRIIPEIETGTKILQTMQTLGYRNYASEGYETIWINLDLSAEELRTSLKGNWRGHLNRAQRKHIEIKWDTSGCHLPPFLQGYATDKQNKNYPGASSVLLKALSRPFLLGKNMLIGHAALDGTPLAAILIFCHGTSATYQAGWTNPAGRENAAGHLLLWDAFRVLKERNIHDFDLGGVNGQSASGIRTFKAGTGGEIVRLPGLFG